MMAQACGSDTENPAAQDGGSAGSGGSGGGGGSGGSGATDDAGDATSEDSVDADASIDTGGDVSVDGADSSDSTPRDTGRDTPGDERAANDAEAGARDTGALDGDATSDTSATDSGDTDALDTGVPESDAGTWTPAQLPNLALWLDAETNVTTANGVLSWADHSGRGHAATQALADFRPALVASALRGHPVIRFDGQNDSLGIADAPSLRWGTGDYTLEIVASYTNATNAGDGYGLMYSKQEAPYPYSGVSLWANYPFPSLNTACAAQLQVGADVATAVTGLNDGVARLYAARRVGTVLDVRLNGASSRSSSVASVNVNAPGQFAFIGGQQTGGGVIQALKGDIAEIVAVGGTLSASDLAKLETYLMSKYGL
jgi:hypothetical protein